MKRKFILSTILLVALSVSAVFLLSNSNKKKQIKKLNTIANKMIVDNLSINYSIPTNEINLNLKNSTQAKDIDAQQYNIIINSIEGKNIIKEKRESDTYLNFECTVDFSFVINGELNNSTIDTFLIFTQENSKYKLKSADDLIKDILEKIAEISTDANLTSMLQNHLIYENDYFNIQFSYPESYNYSIAKGESDLYGHYETITLTNPDTSKKEYIKIYIQEFNENNAETLNGLLINGYKIVNNSISMNENSFTKLENNFNNNGQTEIETVFVLNNTIGTEKYLSITTNMEQNEENIQNLETILKSIKNNNVG